MTQKRLKELLQYSQKTGDFVWKKSSGSSKKGSVARHKNRCGYKVIGLDGTQYLAHRLAWLYMTGDFPRKEIDHINRVRDDNKFANLRDVDKSTNQRNASVRADSSSGISGVCFNKRLNRWRAHICNKGIQISLGVFKNKQDAIKARKQAEKKYNYM